MKKITISMTVKEAQQIAYALDCISWGSPNARNANVCIKFNKKIWEELNKTKKGMIKNEEM